MTSGGLPFQRVAPPPHVAPTAAPPHVAPAAPPPPAPSQPQAPPPVAQAPAPVAQARPAGPRLTVEQLAWLQAQIETSPELGRAARDSLGLNDAEYAAERAF